MTWDIYGKRWAIIITQFKRDIFTWVNGVWAAGEASTEHAPVVDADAGVRAAHRQLGRQHRVQGDRGDASLALDQHVLQDESTWNEQMRIKEQNPERDLLVFMLLYNFSKKS